MKIRADLVGVVEISDGVGNSTILRAGDEVPEGITLGDHLFTDESDVPDEPDAADAREEPEESESVESPGDGEPVATGPYAKTTRARK